MKKKILIIIGFVILLLWSIGVNYWWYCEILQTNAKFCG